MDEVRLRVRLPKWLADKLKSTAENEHKSVSRIIEQILCAYFSK